jgi:uncharacterized membrane protein YhaH (DUF805 family)
MVSSGAIEPVGFMTYQHGGRHIRPLGEAALRSYFDALMRYFNFSGRTGRAQYWIYQLVIVLLFSAAIAFEYKMTGKLPHKGEVSPLLIFLTLFHAIPSITVTVRRLHDIGKSGWWYLLNFIPLGGLFVLVWTCFGSEPGSNDFGPEDGFAPGRSKSRRPEPEPFYARALRPSAASARSVGAGNPRLSGPSERFI